MAVIINDLEVTVAPPPPPGPAAIGAPEPPPAPPPTPLDIRDILHRQAERLARVRAH